MTSFEIAFLFPGQGSQAVGMGVALAASHQPAKHVFDEVNDALNENLTEIMANGPDDLIRMTRNAQPALFATSMASSTVKPPLFCPSLYYASVALSWLLVLF